MQNVLVVEDSKFFLKVLTRRLEEIGLNVTAVENYDKLKDCLDNASDNQFYLAICDLNIPGAQNGEAVQLLSKLNIPTIVFTGSYDEEIRKQILALRVIDYVVKSSPKSIDYLIKSVGGLLLNDQSKILVVDDDELLNEYISEIFSRRKYQVLSAFSGEDALKQLEKHRDVDLVLVDYTMPEMDGYELIQLIRGKFKDRRLSIVGLSGRSDTALTVKFLKNGADDFLIKPFEEEELVSRIARIIDGNRLNKLSEKQSAYVNTIVRTAVDGIVTIDTEGTVETINPAAESMFGYEAEEVIGNNVKMLMPPNYSSEHDGYLNNYKTTGEPKIIGTGREVEGLRKDGTSFPLELSVARMDFDGELKFAGLMRDVSERKLMEQQIKDNMTRIETDLMAAAKLQKAQLPAPYLDLEKASFAHVFGASEFLSGDILDYFKIEDDLYGFYLVDVSGHGVPSALLSVSLANLITPNFYKEALKAVANKDNALKEAVSKMTNSLNKSFQMSEEVSQYFTIVLGIYDVTKEELVFTTAGHPNPILISDGKGCEVGEGDVPVGFLEFADYQANCVKVKSGDFICIYSDGLTECENSNSEQYGTDRLISLLEGFVGNKLTEFGNVVLNDLEKWRGSNDFADDVSVMVFEIK